MRRFSQLFHSSAFLLVASAGVACSSEPSAEGNAQTVPSFNEVGAGTAAAGMAAPGGSTPDPSLSSGASGSGANPASNPASNASELGAMPTEIVSQGGAGAVAPGAGAMGTAGSAMMPGMPSMGAAGAGGAPGAAGSAGQPVPTPVASGCPATALFCDDFEDDAMGQFPGAPWQNQTGSGATVRVDGVQAFSGTRAVHVLAPAGAYRRGYFSLQNGSPIFPAASREMLPGVLVPSDSQSPH